MTGNRKYKTKLKQAQVQALHDLITSIIQETIPNNDEEKLLLATLYELRLRLWQRLGTPQKEYSFSFQPSHAIALRMLYTCYVHNATTYLGNVLHTIANDVHRISF